MEAEYVLGLGHLVSHWELQVQVCVLSLVAKGLEQVDPQPVNTSPQGGVSFWPEFLPRA